MIEISFFVPGVSQSAGSKKAIPIYRNGPNGRELATRANGSPMIAVTDDNPKSREWKALVSFYARPAFRGPPLEGPIEVEFRFYRRRPEGHWGATGLNKQGREKPFPTSKPDVLKLARAVEDALTGICYVDDAQICRERITKSWSDTPGVLIWISELKAEVEEPLTK